MIVIPADPFNSDNDSDFMFEKQYIVNPQDRYVEKDIIVDIPTEKLPLSRWTTVSSDDQRMNHLMNLFFTWDNIVERAFYRPIFEEDCFTDPVSVDEKPGKFCSRFLINALLAASCVSRPFRESFIHCPDSLDIHLKSSNFQDQWRSYKQRKALGG